MRHTPQFTIRAQLAGFAFDVSFAGQLEQLPAVIKRLQSIGAEPISAGAAPHPTRPAG